MSWNHFRSKTDSDSKMYRNPFLCLGLWVFLQFSHMLSEKKQGFPHSQYTIVASLLSSSLVSVENEAFSFFKVALNWLRLTFPSSCFFPEGVFDSFRQLAFRTMLANGDTFPNTRGLEIFLKSILFWLLGVFTILFWYQHNWLYIGILLLISKYIYIFHKQFYGIHIKRYLKRPFLWPAEIQHMLNCCLFPYTKQLIP